MAYLHDEPVRRRRLIRKREEQYSLETSAHDKQRRRVCEYGGGKLLESLVAVQDLANLGGELVKAIDDLISSFSKGDAVLRKLDGHHDESDILRGVGFGGSDTNLGAGVDVDTTVGFSR